MLRLGYERVPMVEGRGQCAMRGSIVDVFPPTELDALRIEFFDDEIDSIRRFDPISQRSIVGRVKDVLVTPASECILGDPETAAKRFEAGHPRARGDRCPPRRQTQRHGLDLDDFFQTIDSEEAAAELAASAILDESRKAGNAVPHQAPSWTTRSICVRGDPSAPRRCG